MQAPTDSAPPVPAQPPVRPFTFICSNCGSDQVVSDAWAEWSIETQQWELGEVFDHTFCLACETECGLVTKDTGPLPAET